MDNANLQNLKKRFLQLHPINATSGGVLRMVFH